jgi:hypothetical protein
MAKCACFRGRTVDSARAAAVERRIVIGEDAAEMLSHPTHGKHHAQVPEEAGARE